MQRVTFEFLTPSAPLFVIVSLELLFLKCYVYRDLCICIVSTLSVCCACVCVCVCVRVCVSERVCVCVCVVCVCRQVFIQAPKWRVQSVLSKLIS